jgi:hypothetical protein
VINMMDRAEHLAWSKERALEYADQGDMAQATASMLSDLRKHPELADHAGIELMMLSAMGGFLDNPRDLRNMIEGFN